MRNINHGVRALALALHQANATAYGTTSYMICSPERVRAVSRSYCSWSRSQKPSSWPKNRPSRMDVSAVIARLPCRIRLMRRTSTCSALASAYWLRLSSVRKSCRCSPGWIGGMSRSDMRIAVFLHLNNIIITRVTSFMKSS